ncbi:sugar transporter [Geosmithia morbida]|uniref:Sugar transporter n=1 Tax=Geosmithia morbida TaxID=1094350 RepID=A0A9P5D3F5_9HYPO|nr:sugar transporter [Geosmithia morbida]KAF4126123.1 sugar transporter [Geosmithia morbida]
MADDSKASFLGLRGQRLALAQALLIMLPAYVLFGYNQANLGSILHLSDWTATFPRIDADNTTGAQKENNSTVSGLVNAVFTLGALPACLSCSYTADKFGRRPVILAGAVLTGIGEVLQASSFSLAQLIVGRMTLGAGVGMLSGTVPTWRSECSDASSRGKNVVVIGLFISLGYVLESWINLGFYQFDDGPVTWRPALAIPVVFSLLLAASIFSMPESPRWLMSSNRAGEARRTLAALRDRDVDSAEVSVEIAAMEQSLEESDPGKASLLALLRSGEDRLRFRFAICLLLQFFQQMAGSNLISVYSSVIFEQGLGLGAQDSRILSGGCLTWKFLSCFVAFFTIDRFGRRKALIVSGAGMASCMIGLAVATSFPKSDYAAQIVSVLFVFLYNFFIPIGFLGANFLYCTEVAPLRLRVAMSSISTANHWLWNFVVIMVTPVAIDSIGYKYYIVYAVVAFCIPFSVYFFYPETMGMSLEDIDLIFREAPSAWTIVRYAKLRPRRDADDGYMSEKKSSEVECKA